MGITFGSGKADRLAPLHSISGGSLIGDLRLGLGDDGPDRRVILLGTRREGGERMGGVLVDGDEFRSLDVARMFFHLGTADAGPLVGEVEAEEVVLEHGGLDGRCARSRCRDDRGGGWVDGFCFSGLGGLDFGSLGGLGGLGGTLRRELGSFLGIPPPPSEEEGKTDEDPDPRGAIHVFHGNGFLRVRVRVRGVRRVPPGEVAWAAAFISRLGVFRHIFFPTGWRIIPLTAPGIATQDPLDPLPRTAQGTVHGDRVDEILRTGREKSAPAKGAAKKVERRRNHHLVDADEEDKDPFHSGRGSGATSETRCINQIHSFFVLNSYKNVLLN